MNINKLDIKDTETQKRILLTILNMPNISGRQYEVAINTLYALDKNDVLIYLLKKTKGLKSTN